MRKLAPSWLVGSLLLCVAHPALAQQSAPCDAGRPDDACHSANDPLARLKDIPLTADGAVSLSLGGQFRLRPEFSRYPVFGLAAPDRNDDLLIRSSLSAALRLGPYVRTEIEVVSGLAPIWSGTPPATQQDRLDLLQGYGEIDLPVGSDNLMLRAGRQELSFGSSRLVSVRESPNIRRAFDGVRAAWIGGPNSRVDAFLVRPVTPLPGTFDDKSDLGQAFWGIYATTPVPWASGLSLDLYYLGLDRNDAQFAQGIADERRHTVGARLFGKADGFDWNVEAAYQFGQFGTANINAWTVSADFGYTFQTLPFTPRLGLNADAISGDHNIHDNTLGTFNPLFPKLPYFSEANLTAPANLLDIQPNVSLNLTPALNLTVGWNPLWKQSEADAFYGPTLNPVPRTAGGTGRYIGQQLSTTLEWNPTPHLTFGATYVAYTPGTRLREAGGRSGSFGAAWATFSF